MTLEQLERIERALVGSLDRGVIPDPAAIELRAALTDIRSAIWHATKALRQSDQELIPIAEALGKIQVAAKYVPEVKSRIKPRPLEGIASGSDLLAHLGLTREVYAESTESATDKGEAE